jgi:hypothetical protein
MEVGGRNLRSSGRRAKWRTPVICGGEVLLRPECHVAIHAAPPVSERGRICETGRSRGLGSARGDIGDHGLVAIGICLGIGGGGGRGATGGSRRGGLTRWEMAARL